MNAIFIRGFFCFHAALNRLTLAKEETTSGFALTCPDSGSVWCEQYSYDVFGNRTVSNETNEGGLTWEVTPSNSYSASTNRIVGWTYDNAGNITAAPSGQTITYDAENRQTQFCVAGSGCDQYVYDGDGRRVQKITSSGTVTYVYDASGNLAAEYGGTATAAGTQYLTTDHLGSTRMVTNQSGAATERHDYLPFGYELTGGWRTASLGYAPETVRQQFTGKERDAETGLDYFGARYFSGAQGRFTSPDWSAAPEPIPYGNLSDPQTLNLYSYVRNNPLSTPDLDGHFFKELWNWAHGDGWRKGAVVESTITYPEEPITNPAFYAVARGMNDAAPVVDALATATIVFVSGPGMGMLESMAAPVGITALGVSGGPAGSGAPGPRLSQDIDVNPVPPAANNGNGTVGPSPTQNTEVQADVAAGRAAGHTDIRVNQQQVNAQGERVGVNRPDLQSTDANGVRHYSEYDRSAQNAAGHHARTLANDPNSVTHTTIIK